MTIARHHAEWLSLIEVAGPFLSMPVLLRAFPQGLDATDPEVARNLRLAYEEWEDNQQGLRPDPAIHTAWVRYVLRTVLEWPDAAWAEGPALPPALAAPVAEEGETLRPDAALVDPVSHQPRLLVQWVAPGQGLERALAGHRWKASPVTRLIELLRATGVRLGLLTNGEQWMLVDAPRGETTGLASWFAALWLEEPITQRAFRSLLGAYRQFGVADAETLEGLLAASASDQQEVTDQLGYQVRRAVEMLVQRLDASDKDRARALLVGVNEKGLYEAALTVMMRLVFLFSAEERGMLLLGDPLYDQYYAVSTLRAQLRATADQHGEEVLERRRDAWSRLLATFRLVYAGASHDRLTLPAYGGRLFDPDTYPFLEGRAPGTGWQETPAAPLPIDNRTVLHLLEALQILQVKVPGGGPAEPRRLSFRALDVEQIGHVYEGLLDHTAVRAAEPVLGLVGTRDHEPEIALAELERLSARGDEPLIAFLKDETGRSPAALRKALAAPPDGLAVGRLRAACDNDAALLARVRPFAGLIRGDSFGYPVVITAGSVYMTAGADRRSTGTHYTPRSLTEPIVQHALDPLVYRGMAEGTPPSPATLRTPREILALKICDMAMGSGAFLVQACRYLAEKLVEAWQAREAGNVGDGSWGLGDGDEGVRDQGSGVRGDGVGEDAHASRLTHHADLRTPHSTLRITPEGDLATGAPDEQILPADAEERLALARRLVCDRCLYGVDKNPMAVEMAKLSLWLTTLQKDRPFTFLDHALRGGDSLLGVDIRQLGRWALTRDDEQQVFWLEPVIRRALDTAIVLRRRIEATPVRSKADADEKARLLARAEEALALLSLGGDLLVSTALEPDPRRRDALRDDLLARFSTLTAIREAQRDRPLGTAQEADWAATRDALAQVAAARLGPHRPFHWPLEFPEVFASPDGADGFSAIIGNPPFQGGARIANALGASYRDYLVDILADGTRGLADLCTYFFLRAARLNRVNGTLALLATNTIAQGDTREVGLDRLVNQGWSIYRAMSSQKWPGTASLEIAHVWMIHGIWEYTCLLDNNTAKGITSLLTPKSNVDGNPHQLAANMGKSFKGVDVGGIGFVLEPDQAHTLIALDVRYREVLSPYLIGEDLNSRPNQSPSRWVINFHNWSLEQAECYPACMEIVREKVKPERDKRKDAPVREVWWQFARTRSELYSTISDMREVLIIALTSKTVSPAFVPADQVLDQSTVVMTFDDFGAFCVVACSFHYWWVIQYGTPMKNDARYSVTTCFETFPFPNQTTGLDAIGAAYYAHRQAIMLARQEGLTKTYNRFHHPQEDSADIVALRRLHTDLDAAVAAAYGWSDLPLGHGFHPTRQGVRYTIAEAARRTVLDRLLALNHARYAAEVAAGLHDKGAGKGKARKAAAARQGTLFGD